ncbi:conserved hypothetical protein [Perkinsus marinus ATCC 50983]|nr:conserved hypothetical protein [Perkinsus marinus ATCC 50983]EER00963.1 conserved hypothetical protein [Perkinsus marinus ATCC 50983]|eukprot:XP_002768245.1 conserved hypothetical protein [Perkinsus marinus ATCC 50983]
MLFPLLSETPKRALKFSTNAQLRDSFQRLGYSGQTLALMSGVGAGICEGAIVCSPELVKIRMQLPENRGLYSSSIQAASAIIRHEGVAALFTGFWCTLLRNACWNGTYFGSIFAIKSTIYSTTKEESKFLNFAAGTIAGSLGCCVNTPLDVVKTRMQNSSALKQARPEDAERLLAVPTRTVPLLLHVARTEGVSSLWKGLAPKIIRLGPGGGIMLVVYEQVTDYLGRLERRAGTH